MNAVVLSNDRSSVVLGVLSEPSSRLISLPRRAELLEQDIESSSSGKGGGFGQFNEGRRFLGIHFYARALNSTKRTG